MKIKLTFLIYVLALTFNSCIADGVEYEEDYTHSDNIVDKPVNDTNDLEQAQYHFELGLKMAVLDKDTIGDWEGAILELDKSLALNPNFQKAYHYKAIINTYLQNYQNAIDNINQAISIDDKAIESYFVRAGIFSKLGKLDKTIEDLSMIISLDPSNGKAYDHRGYAKIETGDKNGGCLDLNKARELGFMVENKKGDELICK